MNKIASVLLTIVSLSCCSRYPVSEEQNGPVVVGFSVSGATKVCADAASGLLSWEDGDNLKLWADGTQGSNVIDGQLFRLMSRRTDRSSAYFSATIPEAMPDGEYNYHCVYPEPESTDDNGVTYTVPDRQTPLTVPFILKGHSISGALSAIDESRPIESGSMMKMNMSAQLHYLRFFIPEGSDILGEPVSRIKFSMPQNIAGKFHTGIRDNSSTLAGGTNTITLSGLSLNEGEDMYALAAIVPPDGTYGDDATMSITIYGASKYATTEPLSIRGRNFAAGHITSVALRAAELKEMNKIQFHLTGNNLGESINRASFSLTDGSEWPEEGSTLVWDTGKAITDADIFTLTVSDSDSFHALNGKKVKVEYESDNAIVSDTFTLNIGSADSDCSMNLTCPYLFEEDFSDAVLFNYSGGLNATGHDSNTIECTEYGLAGWTGNQIALIEGSGNKLMAIRHQNESYFLQGTYRGRLDSAPMKGIREGHSVKVRVSFRYTGYTKGKYTPQISYGYGENQGALSGYYEGGSSVVKGGSLIDTIVGDKISAPKNGTPGNIDKSVSFEINGCNPLTRLAWDCYGTKGSFSNTQEWIFIDDIKVEIIQ